MTFSERYQHLIRENEPLSPYCWLGIGGPARYYAEPTTQSELAGLVIEAAKAGISVRVLGDGSNLLVREAGVDGLVVNLSAPEFTMIKIDGCMVRCGAGARLGHLISRTVGSGLQGLEHLVGIPGTVGGAVCGNAGVTHDDIGNRVCEVSVLDRNGNPSTRNASELQFAFRRSNLDDVIVCTVTLELETGNEKLLTRRMQAEWIIKRSHQPASDLRTVLAFVEPSGASIGDVFEAAGVKGTSEGEVSLSPQFPGYIIASGNATSQQVSNLISRVRKTVELQTGIALQSQLRIW